MLTTTSDMKAHGRDYKTKFRFIEKFEINAIIIIFISSEIQMTIQYKDYIT